MRRHVRYTPLGHSRQVRLQYGLDPQHRDAEIVNDSRSGMGLRLKDCAGLQLGNTVTVETNRNTFQGVVVRLESTNDGWFEVGVQFAKGQW